jgi:thiol-disulfide isomerase/thioredoxin
MRKILILGSILLILIVILRLTQRSVSGFQNPGSELIICKASWCGHCKTAMPEFERLVSASPIKLKDGSDVTIRMLDSDADSAAVQALNIRGFPTILYRRGGGASEEYPGPRTYDGVMGFLNSM